MFETILSQMNVVTKSLAKWKLKNAKNKIKKASSGFGKDTKDKLGEWKTNMRQKLHKLSSSKRKQTSPKNQAESSFLPNDENIKSKSSKLRIKSPFKSRKRRTKRTDVEPMIKKSGDIYKEPKIKAYLKQLREFKQNKKQKDDDT